MLSRPLNTQHIYVKNTDMTKVQSKQVEHNGKSLEEILDDHLNEKDKVIIERVDMSQDYLKSHNSFLIACPEIQKHLEDSWRVQQLYQQPYGVNGTAKANYLVITVHIRK